MNLPILAPGKCVLCGAADNEDGRKFIDFLFHLDWYGRIYFCSECFREACGALGFVHGNELVEAIAKLEQAKSDNLKLNERYSSLKRAFNEQLNDISGDASSDGSVSNDNGVALDVEAIPADSIAAESDSEADEPSSVKGSSSVRKSASPK